MKKVRSIAMLLIMVLLVSGCAGGEEELYDNPGVTYEGVSVGQDSEVTEDTEDTDEEPTQQQAQTGQNEQKDTSADKPETVTQTPSDTADTDAQQPEQPQSDKTEFEKSEETTQPDQPTQTTTEEKNPSVVNIETDLRWFGRTYVKNGTHYFNWTESGFEFTFNGTGAEATFETYASAEKHTAYILIYVDGKENGKSVMLGDSMQTVTLCSGLKKGEHTVRVVKRTNARSSYVGLIDITLLKNGTVETPPAAKTRRIEFVGDSLTVGYGALAGGSDSEWSTETESGAVTYAALAAKALDADYNVIAISGRGLAHNISGDTDKLMPALYAKLDEYNNPGVDWDFGLFVPDVIVINLGTNDHATSTEAEVTAATTEFLKTVRQKNPNAYIIFAYGNARTNKMENAIKAGVAAVGDNKISFFALDRSTDTALGHPSAAAHKITAVALEAEIRRVTGWKD